MFNLPTQDPKVHAELSAIIERLKRFFTNTSAADNLIAFDRNFSFSDDEKFNVALNGNASNPLEFSIFWRLHVLIWFATQAARLNGDFVECGVFAGFSSAVICDYLNFGQLDRQFYLYDTFWGLPEETSTPEERQRGNKYYQDAKHQDLYERVCARFSRYANVKVIKGAVPDSFAKAVPERIAFLHIDMNSAKAEVMALASLYDRMVPGGFIVLDDYGWMLHRPQMLAERQFFAERGKMVMELPTGQGIVMV